MEEACQRGRGQIHRGCKTFYEGAARMSLESQCLLRLPEECTRCITETSVFVRNFTMRSYALLLTHPKSQVHNHSQENPKSTAQIRCIRRPVMVQQARHERLPSLRVRSRSASCPQCGIPSPSEAKRHKIEIHEWPTLQAIKHKKDDR